jgi:hypothetical protein
VIGFSNLRAHVPSLVASSAFSLRLPPVLLPLIIYLSLWKSAVALTIICVTGAGSTGKTSIIRKFTAKHLKYERAKGDVLGIFRMPGLYYAVGVTGSGDDLKFIIRGRKFLSRYIGLRVMIVASRSGGKTIKEVKRFAKRAKATLHLIKTKSLATTRERNAAISEKVSKIKYLMPRR